MKAKFYVIFFAMMCIASLNAQPNRRQTRPPAPTTIASVQSKTNAGDYASDLVVVHDAQAQALEQAKQMLAQGEGIRDKPALEKAIQEMEHAQAALDEAKKSPEKLPTALAAEQTAYQALLKVTPREYRMTRSRNGGQNGNASQPNQRQLDQLEMQQEENRYETERQATSPQTAQQRENLRTADRLKELAQRQQDLNERLRELQNALQAARTDKEREEIQRQLKRLRDEERQMLANMDELRQQLEQSPNASAQAEARQQLDRARSDMERAAQEMERESASQALAAGTRAQQAMQNLREDLRRQTASQFTEQMRQLRNQARELERQQDEIAKNLDSLNNNEHQALDNSRERQQIAEQINRQQSALTNLLAGMRNVTEQAEVTEPLLSKQLYDTLRRADQTHTDNLLEMGSQLTQRGFLPQASQAERAARTNIVELARNVERAAESVLGSETDALRFAQKEMDDLTRQVEREIAGPNTNTTAQSGSGNRGNQNTNSIAPGNARGNENESQASGNQSQGSQRGEQNSASAQNGNRGEQPGESGSGNGEQQASAEGRQNGNGQQGQGGQSEVAGNNPGNGGRQNSNQPQSANSNAQQNGSARQPGEGQGQGGRNSAQGGGTGNRLRQLAEQLGGGNGGGGNNGPITGNDYVNWADRLRDVEQVLDSPDLRNELATVRERAAVLRGEYRQNGKSPESEAVRAQILAPMTQVRAWLQEELARKENVNSLVPLDRDPVPENYSELVRKYYEKLGSAQ